MLKLSNDIIIDESLDKSKIYIITPASDEEIKRGEYLELENGLKISSNPKKHGVITNVKIG